eukprot:jgi/Tetstr1/426131/TSEL_016459.t1
MSRRKAEWAASGNAEHGIVVFRGTLTDYTKATLTWRINVAARLPPGWFNRLFASARLVAPVKKLGEGEAPDMRHVAVGEAERRSAERAEVDGMKEEVTYGAARFNAEDGFLVGLPEHVWWALHAFRTSIKASVGLEVRFDKMHAYNADMEAAQREAPVDIEWPELDGHHASRRRYTHALNHHAWAMLKHCMQHNCLPAEEEAFAEAVDATFLAAVERVLWVYFDPSTYGTDTNPVVTDFMAELLHDPDPMAADAATLSEDALVRARKRLHLPITRLKGAGIRRMATVRGAAFIGCMNGILPRFLTRNSGTNTPTPYFFDPQLGDELKDLSLVPEAELSLPAFNVVTGSYDPRSLKSTLLEFKTMRYGVKYTAVPRATAVDRFERSMLGDIQWGLAARDAAWQHNTEP